jgi:hypothetical protein
MALSICRYGAYLAGLCALLRIDVSDDHLACYCGWRNVDRTAANTARA